MIINKRGLNLCAIAVLATSFGVTLRANAASQTNVLYSFGPAPDGNFPASDLVMDPSGSLYGTTIQGGAFGAGAVFKLTSSNGAWAETILYSFCKVSSCKDGSTPYGGVVLDSSGNIYGTTFAGGTLGGGVVFKLAKQPNGVWRQSILHSFGGAPDGTGPLAGVVFDKTGNLYGTTEGGGSSTASCFGGCGTVFKLTPAMNGQWREKILYNFCSQTQCADGNALTAGVILDASGNIYGTTQMGGSADITGGTVFELSPGSNGQWVEKVLHSFGGSDGFEPHAGLVMDRHGNLYGTTTFGGTTGNNGTVFKLTPGSSGQWTERVLYSFCAQFQCADGASPEGDLVLDQAGNLYGELFDGGAFQWGVVFELARGQGGVWNKTILHDFTGGSDGANPHAGLVFDKSGNLYGETFQGGNGGFGTVIQITP